jgi:hypothetical protein
MPEWPHSAARSVLSQLEGRLFGTEQTRGNLRVSRLLVRLGLIGTAYRIFLPVLWRDPNQCHIFVQLVEAAKVEMSLIESFAGDYRRWSRIERIVSPAFLIAALGGVASMFTPLLGG